jgi:hypothetical protein
MFFLVFFYPSLSLYNSRRGADPTRSGIPLGWDADTIGAVDLDREGMPV